MIDLNSNNEFSDPEAERMRTAISWDRCESPNGYFPDSRECTPEKPTCRIHVVKAAVEKMLEHAAGGEFQLRELLEMRRKWLALEGDDAVEVHDWLIGVVCAIERKMQADALIAKLRSSAWPKAKQ